jgi:hypothetical protein
MKHNSSERGFAHILVVFLVIALAVVVGLAIYNASKARQQDTQTTGASPSPAGSPDSAATPAPDETATWKVFTDKNSSISIKYPTDWLADPETINNYSSFEAATNEAAAHFRINSPGTVPHNHQDYKTYADELAKGLNIEVILFRGVNVTADEWVKSKETIKTSGSGIEPFSEITKVEDLTINGKPAKKVYTGNSVNYTPHGPQGKAVTIIYVDNGKAAMFIAHPYNSQFVNEPFNKIVQTFKFL